MSQKGQMSQLMNDVTYMTNMTAMTFLITIVKL